MNIVRLILNTSFLTAHFLGFYVLSQMFYTPIPVANALVGLNFGDFLSRSIRVISRIKCSGWKHGLGDNQ